MRAYAISNGQVLLEGGGDGVSTPLGFRLSTENATKLLVELMQAITIAQSFIASKGTRLRCKRCDKNSDDHPNERCLDGTTTHDNVEGPRP